MARKLRKSPPQKRPRAIAPERLSLTIGNQNGRALFIQIRDQISDLITRGTLVSEMRLPPVRSLASQLGVNQITVARAYRELSERNLISGRRGGGSFVCAPAAHQAATVSSDQTARPLLAERLFELAHAPGVIAFTSNYPAVDDGCSADFKESLKTALTEKLDSCFHYDPPAGRIELRRQISVYLKGLGIDAETDNILVTSGAQQALDLAVRALVSPGAPVIIEQPAYYGAINAMLGARPRILEVPLQEDGMNLDILENYLRRDQARLIYTNPTFQNPTGTTTSEKKRRDLLALARRYGAVILEDDHCSELRFKGAAVPAIRALAEDDDLVLHARGFGKVFLPGIRLGYLVVPDSLRRKMLTAKAHADLHSSNFLQEAVALYFAKNTYAKFLDRIRRKYGARQQQLYESLVAGMPPGTTVSQPEGGLSFWLTLPEGADVSELYFRAVRRGVAFVSGEVFYVSQSGSRSLRMSFGLNAADELEEGVERLCSVVKDILRRRSPRNLIMM
jgi:2-aminoadipate transaminase